MEKELRAPVSFRPVYIRGHSGAPQRLEDGRKDEAFMGGDSPRQNGVRREGVSQRTEGCVRRRGGDGRVTLVDTGGSVPSGPSEG